MTQPAKSHEPSMEEILASIRKIIADDPGKTPSNATPQKETAPRETGPLAGAQGQAAPFPTPARTSSQASSEAAYAAPSGLTSSGPAVHHDDIDAMLAKLHANSRPAPPPAREPEILDLTDEQMAAQDSESDAAGDYEAIEGLAPAPPAMPDPEPIPTHAPIQPRRHLRRGEEQDLISPATSAAVDSAFNTLAQTVLVKNGRTLEDLVREMLRPMLKDWLDDNLPSLVERLVRAEIERVSRGSG